VNEKEAGQYTQGRTRSIHPSGLAMASLHFLMTIVVGFLGLATAWPSAATHSGPGIIGGILVALQAPVFLLSQLDHELPATTLLILMPPTSVMYGYAIAYLWRRIRPHDGKNDA
jgi:hypothetical protein